MNCCKKMSSGRFPKYSRRLQIHQQFSRMCKTDGDRSEKTGISRGNKSAGPLRRSQTGYSNQAQKNNIITQESISKIPNGKQVVGNQSQKHNSFLPNVHSPGRESRTYSLQWSDSKRQNYANATIKKEDTKDQRAKQAHREMKATKENTISARTYNTHLYVARAERGNTSKFSNNLQQERITKTWEEDKRSETVEKLENEQLIIPNYQAQVKGRKSPQSLPNIGNTCYANSLLQILGQTPELYEKVSLCTEDNATLHQMKRSHVTNAFHSLLHSMNSYQGPKSFTIAEFMNMVSKRDREFSIGYQNDCHSFFLTLLSELHDENPGKDLARMFEIEMVDEFTFDSCNCRDVTDTQIMRSLTIHSESPNVEDGVLDLLHEEIFNESDVPCRDCRKGYGKTRKAMKFHHLPRVIVLQLGCFQEMNYGNHLHIAKSYKRIGFTKDLTVPQSNGKPTTYHLYGVVNHHGSTHGGHYTSYVKHLSPYSDGGHWYYCNDSHVAKSSLFEAMASRDAYLLFYRL